MRAKTPIISYGDSYSPGQLARHWDKPSTFVQSMIDSGKLAADNNGLVTNSALHAFYRARAGELD